MCQLDARVSATLRILIGAVVIVRQRAAAGYLAIFRRVILVTTHHKNIRSAGLRTPAGPRLRTCV